MTRDTRKKDIDKAHLRRLVQAGRSDQEVADALGCTDANVRHHRRTFGLPANRPCRRWTPAELAVLRAMRGLATVPAIGRLVGRPPHAVRDALRRMRRKESAESV